MIAIALVGIVFIVFIALSKRAPRTTVPKGVQVDLPDDLQDSRFWLREQLISCDTKISMSGKPDEVFERQDGVLVPSDTKSRPRLVVYPADVLQVSIYAYILKHGHKKVVSGHGYVRLHTPEKNVYVKVALYSDSEVEDAYEAERLLREGKTTGGKCANRGLCKGCAYKRDCDAMQP